MLRESPGGGCSRTWQGPAAPESGGRREKALAGQPRGSELAGGAVTCLTMSPFFSITPPPIAGTVSRTSDAPGPPALLSPRRLLPQLLESAPKGAAHAPQPPVASPLQFSKHAGRVALGPNFCCPSCCSRCGLPLDQSPAPRPAVLSHRAPRRLSS